MRLSVLMPVYDEASTVAATIERVLAVEFPCEMELVVVDDGSRDGTAQVLASLAGSADPRLSLHRHPVNKGKGAAVRTAAQHASGDYVIVCDADLEYLPEEIPRLLEPVLAGDTEVVYGTRTFSSHNSYSFWYVVGNRLVTTAANVLYNCYVSDLETCFKLLPRPLYLSLDVRAQGFGMEAELTGKLLRRGIRPYELPISYRARTREQGKKLTARDGLEALWILGRVRWQRTRNARCAAAGS